MNVEMSAYTKSYTEVLWTLWDIFFHPHVTSKEFLMKIRQNCRSHYFTPFMRKNGTHSFYMTSYHKLKKARVVEIYDWHTSLRVDMVVVIYNDLLIQWRSILTILSQYFFDINYFELLCKNQSSKSHLFSSSHSPNQWMGKIRYHYFQNWHL